MSEEPTSGTGIRAAYVDAHPTSQSPRSLSDDEATRASTAGELHESDVKHEHDHDRESVKAENPPTIQPTHNDPNFPDGGWHAWLVVFGVRSAKFAILRDLPINRYSLILFHPTR